jgi:hypothetical protein
MNKFCKSCNSEKDVSEFYVRRNRGNGLAGYTHKCKSCSRKTSREYNKREGNFDKKEYNKRYREKHRDKLNEYSKNWRYENVDKMKEQRKLYYQENKEDIVKKNYEYCKNRKKSDSLYKLSIGIRSLILISFKNQFTTKSKKTIEILGCSFEEFKLHLESQFDDKMNWKNQGTYWHMDHIIPISSAETEEDVYRLNHYTNFQPLYWEDNLRKSNKINSEINI